MALLGFQDRFVSKIKRGEKTHTIRFERPDIRVGVRLDLYARPRQKDMKLIFRAPCVKIEIIEILNNAVEFSVNVDGVSLDTNEKCAFAVRDGFRSLQDMQTFWTAMHPPLFRGVIIHWDYSKRFKV